MKQKRNPLFLILSAVSFALILFVVFFVEPTSQITNYHIPALPVFFLLIFLSVGLAGGYAFKSFSQTILIGGFTTIFLLLRFFQLTSPFFALLLLACFASLELFLRKQK